MAPASSEVQHRLRRLLGHTSGGAGAASETTTRDRRDAAAPAMMMVSPGRVEGGGADDVKLNVQGNGMARIHLNRPDKLNATDCEMCLKIKNLLDNGGSYKAALATAEGSRAFCAGGDIEFLMNEGAVSDYNLRFFYEEYKMVHTIGTLGVPFVSVIEGIVMGGGCGITMNGALKVMTKNTMMAMPELGVGLFPDVGASYFLSRPHIPEGLGLFMGLTGHRMNAADCLKAGLATHYVPTAGLPALRKELEESDLGSSADEAVRKILAKHDVGLAGAKADGVEPTLDEEKLAFIKDVFGNSPKSLEDLLEKLQAKATPKSFAEEAFKKITGPLACPLSAKIWFRSVTEGKNKTLAECLKMEYRLACSTTHFRPLNFKRGVGFTIGKKDERPPAPRWYPKSIAECPDKIVDEFFACPDIEGRELNLPNAPFWEDLFKIPHWQPSKTQV